VMAGATLLIDAVLEDPGRPVPDPGDEWLIALMRYGVLRVVEGDYPHPKLFAGHNRPRLGTPEFEVGVRHRLTLTREFPEHANLVAPPDVGELGVFYCPRFEVLEG
jgi:hypothetical protein